ncbi:MAG: adenylyl-sulfate kinase [Acidimicrobiales bacterium]
MSSGTVWFTGLSGAGKSTVANTLHEMLAGLGVPSVLLDGDDLRDGISADLSFSEQDRRENIRRVGEIALLFSKVGHLALVTVISPFASGRQAVRDRHMARRVPFLEIHVATPLQVCEERDPKGLYARARRGEVPRFTGVSAPYEAPEHPELAVETTDRSPADSAKDVLGLLEAHNLLDEVRHPLGRL